MLNSNSLIKVALLATIATTASAHAELIYGLTADNTLFSFDSATPGNIVNGAAITGLTGSESLIGIDFRPATNELVGVTSFNRIITLNTTPGATFGTSTNVAGLSTPLNGTSFDIDFNPTVDRIRIVSDANQNLRVVPTTGLVTTDTNLAFSTGTIDPNIVGAAYTNSVFGATTTTLYTIDAGTNALYVQNPPNNGTEVFIGALGVDATGLTGFDISGATGTAFAALQDGGNGYSQFYTVNLITGAAGLGTTIGSGLFVRDLTVAIPEPTTLGLAGVAAAGLLARRRRA